MQNTVRSTSHIHTDSHFKLRFPCEVPYDPRAADFRDPSVREADTSDPTALGLESLAS